MPTREIEFVTGSTWYYLYAVIDPLAFPEPTGSTKVFLSATEPRVNWYTSSTHPESARGREVINAWYAAFPDANGTFLAKLRSRHDEVHYGAIDELFFYTILAQRYRVTYEENAAGPDFRLYDREAYVGSVEILSFFLGEEWAGDSTRSGQLEDAINWAIPLQDWYVGFEILRWNPQRSPSMKTIVAWVKRQLQQLPEPSPRPTADFLHVPYRDKDKGVHIMFQFIQRVSPTPPKPSDRIVGFPATIGGFVNSTTRLGEVLGKKAGGRYDLRDSPFAIAVANRDMFCSVEEIHGALYGDGGFFRQPSASEGKNTRVSSVFVLQPWFPGQHQQAQILELANPHAQHHFPEPLFPSSTPIAHVSGVSIASQ